jgi:hypothetical protein
VWKVNGRLMLPSNQDWWPLHGSYAMPHGG